MPPDDLRKPQISGHGAKMPRKAEALISALLSNPTIREAAEATGIHESTARRWLKDPTFTEKYREARRQAMQHTTAALQAASSEAVECLRDLVGHGESEPARVAAARTILDLSLKALELEDIESRLRALEQSAPASEKP